MKAIKHRSLEIIIVDNASSDDTIRVAELFTRNVKYIYEPNLGLSHARNRALREASGDYIVYLDDDAVPEEEWFEGIEAAISRNVDVFGGKFTPFYLDRKPDWYLDDFGSAHVELREGPQPSSICFSGGNMGWRRSLVRELGGFDPKLGMNDKTLALGEETALQMIIRENHPDALFWFSEKMNIKHFVHSSKISLQYILKRNFVYGRTLYKIDRNSDIANISMIRFVKISKLGIPLLYRLFSRDRSKYPLWKTYCAHYFTQTGILAGALYGRAERALHRYFAEAFAR